MDRTPEAVVGTEQKSIVLILARELASNVATPIFLLDKLGKVVYYNEPAEALVGQPFAAVGEVAAREWGAAFAPEDLDGNPLPIDSLPPAIANIEQRAAHQTVRVTIGDGRKMTIDMAAMPLFARKDEFEGTIAIFWDHATGRTG